MDSMGMMRDLDQIRERDEGRESSRLVLLALGGLATACVLFAAGVLIGREADAGRAPRREDPLARLDALAHQVVDGGTPSITYPDRLMDRAASGATEAPSGAERNGRAQAEAAPSAGIEVPASALVDGVGRVRTPEAPARLPIAAANHARLAPAAASSGPAAPGSDGAYTLQVSSFRSPTAAQQFAQRLRERGHRTFVTAGPATTGGAQWHRVRIGPFSSLREANRYRADFESRERLPTFVVRRDGPRNE